MKPLNLFLETLPGLEFALVNELKQLGGNLVNCTAIPGGVKLAGHHSAMYRVCFESRLVSRVYLRIGAFEAQKRDQFIHRFKELPLKDYLREFDNNVHLRVFSTRSSTLYHSGLIEEIAREGLEMFHRESSLNNQSILINGQNNKFHVSIEASGLIASQRGYREGISTKMPLRPTFSAACIQSLKIADDAVVVDPMCGSGTMLVELAMMRAGITPGHVFKATGMNYNFEKWPVFDSSRFEKVIAAADEKKKSVPSEVRFFGSDRDEGAIEASKSCASSAGVQDWISFEHRALADVPLEKIRAQGPEMWIVSNPPFGPRAGVISNLRPLYANLGDRVRSSAPDAKVALVSPPEILTKRNGIYATGFSWHQHPSVSAVFAGRRLEFWAGNFEDDSVPLQALKRKTYDDDGGDDGRVAVSSMEENFQTKALGDAMHEDEMDEIIPRSTIGDASGRVRKETRRTRVMEKKVPIGHRMNGGDAEESSVKASTRSTPKNIPQENLPVFEVRDIVGHAIDGGDVVLRSDTGRGAPKHEPRGKGRVSDVNDVVRYGTVNNDMGHTNPKRRTPERISKSVFDEKEVSMSRGGRIPSRRVARARSSAEEDDTYENGSRGYGHRNRGNKIHHVDETRINLRDAKRTARRHRTDADDDIGYITTKRRNPQQAPKSVFEGEDDSMSLGAKISSRRVAQARRSSKEGGTNENGVRENVHRNPGNKIDDADTTRLNAGDSERVAGRRARLHVSQSRDDKDRPRRHNKDEKHQGVRSLPNSPKENAMAEIKESTGPVRRRTESVVFGWNVISNEK